MRSGMRRLLWILTACLILLTGTLLVRAEGELFSDVPYDSWFYEDVMALTDSGVIGGYPDGTYRPTKNVTTGEALKMILLASGYPEPEQVSSHWARGYLNFAIDQGFLTRYEDISDLDVPMTRGLVAKLAANALGLTADGMTGTFTDTDSSYVEALYAAGIVDGYPDGTFRPGASVTRAEIAAIVHRIYNSREPVQPVDPDITPEEIHLRTSEQLIALLKQKEGFRATAYWDYAQYSIGYGSACTKDEYPNGITEAQADLLLREMLQKFETSLDKFLQDSNLTLTDNQYDALISLTYNIGAGWMKDTRLSKLLQSGNYTNNEIASAIGIWCHVKENGVTSIHNGLVSRRIAEINVFLYGDYSGSDSGFCWVKFTSDKGSCERDIAFYEIGSTYDPLFTAECDDGDVFAGWYTEDGEELTADTTVWQNLTVTARWQSEEFWY